MLILDRLLSGLKDACAAFPDKRKGEGVYSMADIGLSAFSLFFMQSESFLSYQRSLAEGRKTSNCHTLFGMAKIPTDNHIRSMLDPVHPSYLQGSFDAAVAALHADLGETGGAVQGGDAPAAGPLPCRLRKGNGFTLRATLAGGGDAGRKTQA